MLSVGCVPLYLQVYEHFKLCERSKSDLLQDKNDVRIRLALISHLSCWSNYLSEQIYHVVFVAFVLFSESA